MNVKRTAITMAALAGLGLSGAAFAQQQGGQQAQTSDQGYEQWYGEEGGSGLQAQQQGQQQQMQGIGQGQAQGAGWIMETEQIRNQLQQGLRAYNNNLDDTSATIVREAAEEVRQQAGQIIGGPSQRALRLTAQQLNELADKIETNQLQSTAQFRETANQALRQLNQVQQIQQAMLNIQFQGIDEAQVSQYREQLNRAFQAYQNNNDQVAVAVLRSLYNDIRRQTRQVQQNQGGTNQVLLLNRAAARIRQLGGKIQNNDLQSVTQFRQTANQVLQQLNQARELQQIAQQGQFWQSEFWQVPQGQGPQTQQQFGFQRGGFGYRQRAGDMAQQGRFRQQGFGQNQQQFDFGQAEQAGFRQQGGGQGQQWFDAYQGGQQQQQRRPLQQRGGFGANGFGGNGFGGGAQGGQQWFDAYQGGQQQQSEEGQGQQTD